MGQVFGCQGIMRGDRSEKKEENLSACLKRRGEGHREASYVTLRKGGLKERDILKNYPQTKERGGKEDLLITIRRA